MSSSARRQPSPASGGEPPRAAVRVAGAVTADAVVSAVAVEAGGSRVFVGTVAGWVLVYELKGSNPEARTLSQTHKRSFGRKPVEVRQPRPPHAQRAAG